MPLRKEELYDYLEESNIWKRIAPRSPERETPAVVLGTDVEGPLCLGDFIAEALTERLLPKRDAILAFPSYGNIMYQTAWEAFNADTLGDRKPLTPKPTEGGKIYTLGQEGTDTIFTLPLLLAAGATYEYLCNLTRQSKATPGSDTFIKELERQGVLVVGITTAPQEPYRDLFRKTGLLDPTRVIGSPFPIEETRKLLQTLGVWDEEMALVQTHLDACYQIINEGSTISDTDGTKQRTLSPEGTAKLAARIRTFHEEELGFSYDPRIRAKKQPHTVLGQVIEATTMVGDRSKAAIAKRIARGTGKGLITMGDGLNDSLMLQMAPISIGINGADAARAAKIGIITPSMEHVLPIFQQVLKGEQDIATIIRNAQAAVGTNAIIHQGGPDVDPGLIDEHKRSKRALRGGNIIY